MDNKAELELKYHEICGLYDLAEEMLNTCESDYVSDPEAQLSLIEPLVEQVGESADVLTEEFINVAGGTGNKKKIEAALRKLFMAVDEYQKRVKASAANASQSLINIADPIVEKIKRQVETIIAIFIDFVALSLDRIMHKSQIDEMKQRQEKIALMLHGMGQQGFEHG